MIDRKEIVIDFAGKTLCAKVSQTSQERAHGLMGVRSLGENEGMLFVMEKCEPASFWMKNTYVPLDIAFLDESMRILKISQMEPLSGKSSSGNLPVKYVIEAPLGWFSQNGVLKGQKMSIANEEKIVRSVVDEILEEIWQRPTCFGDIVYRPFSDMFFQTIREMKNRAGSLNEGLVPFDNFHREALTTDIGEFGLYEGVIVPLDIPIPEALHEELIEAKKKKSTRGKLPPGAKLNVPRRGGDGSKFHVYVRDPKTKKVKKVGFGAKGMSVGINNPKRRKSFAARHNCEDRNDKTKASYWSCRLPRYWKALGMKKTSFKWW